MSNRLAQLIERHGGAAGGCLIFLKWVARFIIRARWAPQLH